MRPVPLTNLTQGINRLRVKGGADPQALYDLLNAYINQAGTVRPRPGTTRAGTLSANGGIAQLGTLTGGSGYDSDGTHTYDNVPLTGGTGSGATADITVTSGVVTAVDIVEPGEGYTTYPTQDSLSASNTHLGGSGSGFAVLVAQLNTTVGLAYFDGSLNVFATSYGSLAPPFALNVLPHPTNPQAILDTIWFAQPFMGFLYVVAQFDSGDIFHYWLQNNGAWDELIVYVAPAIVTPLASPNGLNYSATRVLPVNPTWSPNMIVGTASDDGPLTYVITDAGEGYADGNFYQVPLTGGTGTGAAANIVVVGGEVSSITVVAGQGYAESDHLACDNSYLGGRGDGFQLTVSTVGTLIGIQVPMIEPSTPNGYYYVPTVYEYAPATPGTPLNIATGSTEPIWPTSIGGQVEDAGNYLQYTNAQLQAVGGAPSNILSTTITDRYGDSNSIAGLTSVSTTLNAATLPLVVGALGPWATGTLYQLGAIVTPSNLQGAYANAVYNGNFYQGGTVNSSGWDLAGGQTVGRTAGSGVEWETETCTMPGYTTDAGMLQNPGGTDQLTTQYASQDSEYYGPVTPGQSVTATCYYSYSGSTNTNGSAGIFDFYMILAWYSYADDSYTNLGYTIAGPFRPYGGGWAQYSVTGDAPAGAQFCQIAIQGDCGYTGGRGTASATLFQWNITTAASATQLIYQCTGIGDYTLDNVPQGLIVSGTSGQTEPVWPTNQSGEVTDGQLTWTAVGSSIIIWTGYPIMYSGGTEPVWPVVPGQGVWDGSTTPLLIPPSGPPYSPAVVSGVQVWEGGLIWECISSRVTDPNCPNTNIVALGASHIFAGDNDIVPFCAAVNPTDWSTSNNAGYLPTGLQNYGANPVAVMGLYRSNLMVFNSGGYQMWQIDPDPANMAILDAQPIGTTYTRGAQTVGTDMIILTPLGIRNVGMTGATVNMQTGMFGQPIDDLVQAQINAATYVPISLYYPARGQYWCFFGPQAFVGTQNEPGKVLWSRYEFPDSITDWTLWGDNLYLRTAGNLVWEVDPSQFADDVQTGLQEVSTVSPTDGTATAYDTSTLGTVDSHEGLNYTVTITEFEGQPIPSPLEPETTYYVRELEGSNPAIVGLALTEEGDIITSYSSGESVMNWIYPDSIVVTSVAGSSGYLIYEGDAGLSNLQEVTVLSVPDEALPLPEGAYYVDNYSYADGVSTFTLSTSDTGSPAYFLLAGECNLQWSISENTSITSGVVAGPGVINCATFGSTLPDDVTINFTGTPPAPCETDTDYILAYNSPQGGYNVYDESDNEIILTSVGSFDIEFPGTSDTGGTATGTGTVGTDTNWIISGTATTQVLVEYMEISLSNGTGVPPFPAGTYYIGALTSTVFDDWAIQLYGYTLEYAIDDLPAAMGADYHAIYSDRSTYVSFSLDGSVSNQEAFTTLVIGGYSYTAADASFSASSFGASIWEWSYIGGVPANGGSMNVAAYDSSGILMWQAYTTVATSSINVGSVGYNDGETGPIHSRETIGSYTSSTFGYAFPNATSSFAATATLSSSYGSLDLSGSYALEVGYEVTLTGGSLPAPLEADTNYYIVSVVNDGSGDTASNCQLSLSSGGTPIRITANGSGTMNFNNPQSIDVTSSPGFFGYLLGGVGEALPLGTEVTVSQYESDNIPSPLEADVNYWVVATDETNTYMYLGTANNVEDEIDITEASTCNLLWNQPETTTLTTVAGLTGYILLGNSSFVPVVGQEIQFSEYDDESLPAPFETDTNYYITSIIPDPVVGNAYDFQVSLTLGGSDVVVGAAGDMNMTAPASSIPFDSLVWWPWLDCGAMGVDKAFVSFHIAGTGDAQVSFGWNENDLTAFTPLYDLGLADTVPDFPIGLGITAKTISPYVYFAGPQNWSLEAFIMYVNDLGLA